MCCYHESFNHRCTQILSYFFIGTATNEQINTNAFLQYATNEQKTSEPMTNEPMTNDQ